MNKPSLRNLSVSLIVAIVLAILGLVLFLTSYTTNYFTFGTFNSTKILTFYIIGLVALVADLVLTWLFPKSIFTRFTYFIPIFFFIYGAMLLTNDRVEAVGTTILTDYDSGHGGEEACYLSICSVVAMVASSVFIVIGGFKDAKSLRVKNIVTGGVGAGVFVGTLVTALALSGVFNAKSSGGGNGTVEGKYGINVSQSNQGDVPYFFLSPSIAGIMRNDARFNVDVSVDFKSDGAYSLFADAYCVEAGKRATIGDGTGLGLVYTNTAEGTYTVNADQTITISVATHAVIEIETDEYSAQMRNMMKVPGTDGADGTYDSANYPVVLDYVPETTFTIKDGAIASYKKAAPSGAFSVTLNQTNFKDFPYFFLASSIGGIMRNDARFNIDVKLTLDGSGAYTLFADGYCIEAGKRAVIGDGTGLGLVYTNTAEGAYVANDDGSVSISAPTHAVIEIKTDEYSAQMRNMMKVPGTDGADGTYDSAEYPVVLDYVPDTTFVLGSGTLVSWSKAAPMGTFSITINQNNQGSIPYIFLSDKIIGIIKADGRFNVDVKLTLDGQGGYVLFADSYVIEAGKRAVIGDGTGLGLIYTNTAEGKYEANDDGTVTIDVPTHAAIEIATDEYSAQMRSMMKVPGTDGADGVYDSAEYPVVLDYVPATTFTMSAGQLTSWSKTGGEPEPEPEPGEETEYKAISDDEGTYIMFYSDLTYAFHFDSYNIVDEGTWNYADGTLTMAYDGADANCVSVAGNPLKFTYAYSKSEQLIGSYTIDPADLEALLPEPSVTEFKAMSDDEGTYIMFYSDMTYAFHFDSYNIVDEGTWSLVDGTLTMSYKGADGACVSVSGDPLVFTYSYSKSSQLTGDYTIAASNLSALL